MINQSSNLSLCHINQNLMINQSSNLSLSMSLSMIYHRQPTITRSTHMDTKTITISCTSTMYHNLYHTMHQSCIDHVQKPIQKNVPHHVPKHVPNHVLRSPISASSNVPYHHQLMKYNIIEMCLNIINHVPITSIINHIPQ
jgi:hypothetical protein